jgi:D-sedoheptulose 7-phosphate isomerase
MPGTLDTYLGEAAALIELARQRNFGPAAEKAIETIVAALGSGKSLLVCGNGGSASDAMHIAGELVARFFIDRQALNVIALSANPAMLTSWANDVSFETVYARQVEAHGQEGGVLMAISTSGNSANIVRALETAKARGLTTIGLTGQGGGRMAPLCDILLDVPSRITPRIQEVHVLLYHYICAEIEARLARKR